MADPLGTSCPRSGPAFRKGTARERLQPAGSRGARRVACYLETTTVDLRFYNGRVDVLAKSRTGERMRVWGWRGGRRSEEAGSERSGAIAKLLGLNAGNTARVVALTFKPLEGVIWAMPTDCDSGAGHSRGSWPPPSATRRIGLLKSPERMRGYRRNLSARSGPGSSEGAALRLSMEWWPRSHADAHREERRVPRPLLTESTWRRWTSLARMRQFATASPPTHRWRRRHKAARRACQMMSLHGPRPTRPISDLPAAPTRRGRPSVSPMVTPRALAIAVVVTHTVERPRARAGQT